MEEGELTNDEIFSDQNQSEKSNKSANSDKQKKSEQNDKLEIGQMQIEKTRSKSKERITIQQSDKDNLKKKIILNNDRKQSGNDQNILDKLKKQNTRDKIKEDNYKKSPFKKNKKSKSRSKSHKPHKNQSSSVEKIMKIKNDEENSKNNKNEEEQSKQHHKNKKIDSIDKIAQIINDKFDIIKKKDRDLSSSNKKDQKKVKSKKNRQKSRSRSKQKKARNFSRSPSQDKKIRKHKKSLSKSKSPKRSKKLKPRSKSKHREKKNKKEQFDKHEQKHNKIKPINYKQAQLKGNYEENNDQNEQESEPLMQDFDLGQMIDEKDQEAELQRIREQRQNMFSKLVNTSNTPINPVDVGTSENVNENSDYSQSPIGIQGTMSNSQPEERYMDQNKQNMLKFLEQQRENYHLDSDLSPKPEKDELSPNLSESEKSEQKDDYDMFDVVNMKNLDEIQTKQIDQLIEQSGQAENDEDCDDNENYLKIRTGQIMKGQYKVIQKLGKGVFSNVVRVIDIKTNEECAIKILRNDEIMARAGEKEKLILEKLNKGDKFDKRHIIRILGSFEYKKHLCLVFEVLEMNLRDAIKVYSKGKGFGLDYVRSFGQQLFKALYHMRKEKVIHADIKPDNILISQDTKTIKLCDFGTAFPSNENTLVEYLVSRYYRAPEIIIGYVYGMEIDVWSTGVTLYELFSGNFLFEGRDNNQMIKLILQKKGKFNNKMLRQGVFINKYFDKDHNFLSKEVDPVTKQLYLKPIKFGDQPTHDLGTLLGLKNVTNQEEYKKLNNFKDLLEKCLQLDPRNRITPEEALNHPFLNPTGQKKLI